MFEKLILENILLLREEKVKKPKLSVSLRHVNQIIGSIGRQR